MPTKTEKVGRHGSTNPVMPVFVLISLLSHLLILIFLTKITATPQSDGRPQYSDSLSVKIYKPPPRASSPKLQRPEPKTETERRLDKTITVLPDTRSEPQQFLKQPLPRARNTQHHEITAIELMQEAFNAIPAIAKAIEQKDSSPGETVVFDLRFRKKPEQLRREQTRLGKLYSSLAKHPEIEMISDYGDYFAVRIDGRCWKMPVPDESNPFDARIVMRDFRCK